MVNTGVGLCGEPVLGQAGTARADRPGGLLKHPYSLRFLQALGSGGYLSCPLLFP